MIRLFLLAALLIAPVAAERSLAPGIAPEPFTSDRLAESSPPARRGLFWRAPS